MGAVLVVQSMFSIHFLFLLVILSVHAKGPGFKYHLGPFMPCLHVFSLAAPATSPTF